MTDYRLGVGFREKGAEIRTLLYIKPLILRDEHEDPPNPTER